MGVRAILWELSTYFPLVRRVGWSSLSMLPLEAVSLLKHSERLKEVFLSYSPFLGHLLFINIQEKSFQGKITTGVGNMRLVYKRAVLYRPVGRIHQCVCLQEDFVWLLPSVGWLLPHPFTTQSSVLPAKGRALGEPKAAKGKQKESLMWASFSLVFFKNNLAELLLIGKVPCS